jgi:hypothetical protein
MASGVLISLFLMGSSCNPTAIVSVTPSSGPSAGGTALVIKGTGFQSTDKITIAGVTCPNLKYVSSSEFDCTAPAHVTGAADIALLSSSGSQVDTLAGGYTYICDSQAQPGLSVWANNGEDKVTQDELRGSCSPLAVINSIWNGSTISLFAAKNEVVEFNTILEAVGENIPNVNFSFSELDGPGGAKISSVAATGDGIFDWTQRNIENFYVRYLAIHGLSTLGYDGSYDERHVPIRLRRPWTGDGEGTGTWTDRPDHDKSYPDIAVPLEVQQGFTITANQNQSIWTDIYVPTNTPTGTYTGMVTITSGGTQLAQVPVSLVVRGFALPDVPTVSTMMFMGYKDVSMRYFGMPNTDSANDPSGTLGPVFDTIRQRHWQIAHRHKLTVFDDNEGYTAWTNNQPRPVWIPALNGSLYTAASGYAGPGVGVPHDAFVVGPYGTWSLSVNNEQDMWNYTNGWEGWFEANYPNVFRFLYLADEPQASEYAQVDQYAQWVHANSGVGSKLKAMVALNLLPDGQTQVPHADVYANWFDVGDTVPWNNAVTWTQQNNKLAIWYNGKRPASGSFMTDDDGVALREVAWGQYKKAIPRWYYWESTYYDDNQSNNCTIVNSTGASTGTSTGSSGSGGTIASASPLPTPSGTPPQTLVCTAGRGEIDVMNMAHTYGTYNQAAAITDVFGQTGYDYSNGDGVMFYPGTDKLYPNSSYGLNGPIASLRMKHWRRGVQDTDYLALANKVNPAAVQALIAKMVPTVMQEVGVDVPSDPTYKHCDISWSTNPDDWEAARLQLANIIDGTSP